MEEDQSAVEVQQRLATARRLEALGTVATGVAHDFGNMIAALQINLHLVLTTPDGRPDEMREHLNEMEQVCSRAEALVRQLLAFAGRHPQEPSPLDLRGAVADMALMIRRLLPAGMDLKVVEDDEPVVTVIDRASFEQVVLNLVVNARDAYGSGRGSVHLAVRNSADRVHFVCADNGVGMTPEVLERAVEPFYTTKPPGHGTGLGLSTVLGVVEQAGGRLRIESTPTMGTTVTVDLPRIFE